MNTRIVDGWKNDWVKWVGLNISSVMGWVGLLRKLFDWVIRLIGGWREDQGRNDGKYVDVHEEMCV